MIDRIREMCVSPNFSVREVIECLNRNGKCIAVVVDEEDRLITTITDGDLRRAILRDIGLETSVNELVGSIPDKPPKPISAPVGSSDEDILALMNEHSIRHVPVLDESERVVDVVCLSDLAKEMSLTAVVMAGGYGTRLGRLTKEMPKPMLKVGDRPILEVIINQLKAAGIRKVNVTTHYRRQAIWDYFQDGQDFGVDIRYVNEDHPLGTAGSLGLVESSRDPLLVINGDVLTRVDYNAMLDFHQDNEADMTVAVRTFELSIPYGVIELEDVMIKDIAEKPVRKYPVNAGIYLVNPDVCRLIPEGESYDMPDLIRELIDMKRRVVGFPVHEYWLDVGHPTDYWQAQEDIRQGRL
ncbi:nucleotidyltransferase family protein [Thermodesulfobacteriota bacterium]